MNHFVLNKKEIITSIFILLCLAGYVYFPASGYFQYKAVVVIFLVLLPFLYNKYFLKEKNFFKRILIGDWKNSLKLLSIGLTGAFLIMFLIFKFTDIGNHYFLASGVKDDFWQFLKYELTGIAFTVAIYELFFRGFVMSHFLNNLKKWAILAQFLFFLVLLLMLHELPYWFYIVYLVFAPFAGWIAYKSDSILYSFLGQLLFVIVIDASYIALIVRG
jgi:membrane protease YdiL (CAAX protease family)